MLAAFHEAKRLKYNAVRFFQMLSDRGALATAKTLLAGDVNKVSDGFTAMWDLKRLDLTVEAICLDPRFKPLFTEQELATARTRLENAGYALTEGLGNTLWRLGDTFRETITQPPKTENRLRVFLCHSNGDKPVVRKLYQHLKQDGFAPWLDEEDLIPGQDWREEIPAAVRACNVVVVCLSKGSTTKEGYVQKEIKVALDVAQEKPEGTIFIIPARLEEDVNVPERLSQWHWVNLFQDSGYDKLIFALNTRANALEDTGSSPKITERKSLQVFNFNGTPDPILVSGKQHSVHGPFMDLYCLVTIVNYTHTPMKIGLHSLVFKGSEYPLTKFFFRPKSKLERFERISLLGNSKEDYELHFMFPDDRYPQACLAQLFIQTDQNEPILLDLKFSSS